MYKIHQPNYFSIKKSHLVFSFRDCPSSAAFSELFEAHSTTASKSVIIAHLLFNDRSEENTPAIYSKDTLPTFMSSIPSSSKDTPKHCLIKAGIRNSSPSPSTSITAFENNSTEAFLHQVPFSTFFNSHIFDIENIFSKFINAVCRMHYYGVIVLSFQYIHMVLFSKPQKYVLNALL